MKEVTHHLIGEGHFEPNRVWAEGMPDTKTGLYQCYRVNMQAPEAPEIGGSIMLRFQNGSLEDKGCNGLSERAVLAAILDRLETRWKQPNEGQGAALLSLQLVLSYLKTESDQ